MNNYILMFYNTSDINRQTLGKILFYLPTISLLGLAFVLISWPELLGKIIIDQTNQFLSSSQLLFVNLVGFVFIIVVFLIQNTTQSYSANLSKEVSNDLYLRLILIILILLLLYNTTIQYFRLSGIFELFSFAFSIAAVLYLTSLISFTAYYLDISNILDSAGERISKSISYDRLFDGKFQTPNKQEHQKLLNDIIFLRNLSQEAIENKDWEVANTGIENIQSVCVGYIEVVDFAGEDLFEEMNSQYEFLLRSATREYTRQKFLNPIVLSMGTILREIYKNTKDNTATSYWINSIKNVFYTTLDDLDRTKAYSTSIQEINRFLVLSLEKPKPTGYDYTVHLKDLDEISEECIEEGHEVALQSCLYSYMWQIVTMINGTIKEQRRHPPRKFQKPLDSIVSVYVDGGASTDIDSSLLLASYYGLDSYPTLIRYYGLYGLDPNRAALNAQITSSPPEEFEPEPRDQVSFDYPQSEEWLVNYFESIIETQKTISSIYIGTNRTDHYSAYPELLFVFCNDLNLEYEDSQILVDKLTSVFCNIILTDSVNKQNNRPREQVIKEDISDYMLISVYYYGNDDDSMNAIISNFTLLYMNLVDELGRKDARWLYRLLKLVGSLIHSNPKLSDTRKFLDTVLAKGFYEPQNQNLSQQIQPREVQLGYPPINHVDGYQISSRQVWSGFDRYANNKIFTHFENKIERYHRYLERESNWV